MPNGIENSFDNAAAIAAKSDALQACIENPDCETRTAAQFEMATLILDGLEVGKCNWTMSPNGQHVTRALNSGANGDGALSLDDWVKLGPEKAQALMRETAIFQPHTHNCDYDDQSDVFQNSYVLLEASHSAGNHDATARLGSLHISDPDLFDLNYARSILETCDDYGGGFCAFHLAQIESLTSEDGCGRCLGLMRIADRRTGDKRIRFAYYLAKRTLGRGEIVGPVFFDHSADSGTQAYLEEFGTLFPNLVARETIPPAP